MEGKNRFSLVVITKNEENNIGACLKSVPFADEVIVVDSGSTDRTKEIVEGLKARFIHNDWPGYGKQKQFALDKASHDWVLLLDADEYLDENLQAEIKSLLAGGPTEDAYRIPRKQIFMGKLCHYGKSVDHPVRLTNRRKGSYDLKNIHESFVTKGSLGTLKNFMIHNSGITVLDRCKKIMRDFELELQNNNSPDMTAAKVVFDPIRYFLSYYLRHQGYRDGFAGYVMTALFALQMFIQNAGQYEKNLFKPANQKIDRN